MCVSNADKGHVCFVVLDGRDRKTFSCLRGIGKKVFQLKKSLGADVQVHMWLRIA